MEEFKKEVAEMSINDIMLILEDQLDLYTDEEIAILRQELAYRSCSNDTYEKEMINKILKIKREEERIEENKKILEEQRKLFKAKIDNLRSQGYKEYYEYTALTISDNSNGTVDINEMINRMNELALNGWKLVTAFTNEIGKDSFTGGFGGISSGVNSTIEQNILLFERKVSINTLDN